MFVRCPRCHSLVATDAATSAAPEYCPYCDGPMAVTDVPVQDSEASDIGSVTEPSADMPATAEAADSSDTTPSGDIADTRSNQDERHPADTAPASLAPAAAESYPPMEPAAEPLQTVVQDSPQSTQAPPNSADQVADASTERDTAADAALAEAPATPKRRKNRAAPSFARRPANAPRRPTPRRLWAVVAGLALLAALQILFADRAQLAADARWRPMLASACDVLHCTIPPWREPAAFTMLRRDVRQHPYMPGALRVDAAFRNDARWAQPWPELVLTLSDVDGRALGARVFSPQEYLGAKITQNEIATGQIAAIRMDVMEPAPGVVSFSFDFR